MNNKTKSTKTTRGRRATEIGKCPVCRTGKFMIEELHPVFEGDPPSWRVICYGCNISTLRRTSKPEALKIHTKYLSNLAKLQQGEEGNDVETNNKNQANESGARGGE